MIKFSSSMASIAAVLISGNVQACEIVRLMAGKAEVSKVENHWDGESYPTYLVRNNIRDQNEVLNNWIKFELIPQRWGFDLELPDGRRFAQVNKAEGKWEVTASAGFMDSCAGSYVTLRKNTASTMDVYDGMDKIGEIERFPFSELF